MQKNRIQIDGVWYVRENSSPTIYLNSDDVSEFQGMLYETDNYAFEATRFKVGDSDEYMNSIDIKYTDKRTKPWKEEYWDNNYWFAGILENNPDSAAPLTEIMCPRGVEEFKAFLKYLQEKNWL